ncbi:hypothetical protein C8R44DRAFT_740825 [Mycena epipterygia]|nr:hypothetical protein C8R44DRAFT_740825 [Mycena epipterygia]
MVLLLLPLTILGSNQAMKCVIRVRTAQDEPTRTGTADPTWVMLGCGLTRNVQTFEAVWNMMHGANCESSTGRQATGPPPLHLQLPTLGRQRGWRRATDATDAGSRSRTCHAARIRVYDVYAATYTLAHFAPPERKSSTRCTSRAEPSVTGSLHIRTTSAPVAPWYSFHLKHLRGDLLDIADKMGRKKSTEKSGVGQNEDIGGGQ